MSTVLGEVQYKPDLVVTKDDKIIGIIEMKFTPQEGKWENNYEAAYRDLQKLALYSQGRSKFPKENTGYEFLLELNPKSGAYDTSDRITKYKLDPKRTKYFYLGIAWFSEFDLEEALLKKAKERELKGEFMSFVHRTQREN